MMNRTCVACREEYTVRDQDIGLLERISPSINGITYLIPPPHRCPSCREQLRMAWRNEVHLFSRTCDKTGERLISMYPPQTPFPVYRHREWFKDTNDATAFGRSYAPDRSIFDQMREIQKLAPRFHVYNFQEELDENSQYTNCAGCNKNCYLMFAAGYNELCLYGRYVNKSFNCIDLFFSDNCRNCYEGSDLLNCDTLFYSSQCKDCHNSWFLYDCRGCHDCIGCVGLRQKSYCIFNKQFSREEFQTQKNQLNLAARSSVQFLQQKLEELIKTSSHRYYHGDLNEESTGDYISNTRRCFSCFDSRNAEDSAYCTFFIDGKDSMDVYSWGEMELCYQVSGGGSYGMYRAAFTAKSYGCKESYYLDHCVYCDHCFACVGLNRKSYCILNKQYTKEEYETLVPRIIEGMIQRGEWGEYLPGNLSPFPYNHSVGADFYPLTKDEAIKSGFQWSDFTPPPPKSQNVLDVSSLPSDGAALEDSLLDTAIRCARSGKLFKITKAELSFYRENQIPPPLFHPEERQKLRLMARNPRHLWDRACASCSRKIISTYAPQRPERVLCERCYENEIL